MTGLGVVAESGGHDGNDGVTGDSHRDFRSACHAIHLTKH